MKTNPMKKLIAVFVVLTLFTAGLFAEQNSFKGKIVSTNIGKTKLYVLKTEENDMYVLSVLNNDFAENYFVKDKPGKKPENPPPPPKPDPKYRKSVDAKSEHGKYNNHDGIKNEGNYYERPKEGKIEIVGGDYNAKKARNLPTVTMLDIKGFLNETVNVKGYLDKDSGVLLVTEISLYREPKKEQPKKKKPSSNPAAAEQIPTSPIVIF